MSVEKGRSFWGPPIWKTIHILAATLRPDNAQAYKQFLESLTELLPCERCKKNLKDKLKRYPPDPYLSNNQDAFFYSYVLHDLVNQQVEKDSPNLDDIKSFYFSKLVQECKDCQL